MCVCVFGEALGRGAPLAVGLPASLLPPCATSMPPAGLCVGEQADGLRVMTPPLPPLPLQLRSAQEREAGMEEEDVALALQLDEAQREVGSAQALVEAERQKSRAMEKAKALAAQVNARVGGAGCASEEQVGRGTSGGSRMSPPL